MEISRKVVFFLCKTLRLSHIALMTGVLEWKDTGSLGKAGRRNGGVTVCQ